MRLDVVSIFPDYLAPLDLSLIGQARRKGLLDVRVHDLRDFTHDRHRTVDDTPYGGGAGMVMKPEPWAEALDSVVASGDPNAVPLLVVPGPGGEPFTQAMARELAAEPWVAFACGRYEGIDERVYEHAAQRMRVRVVSLGDYVLNGGEVAVLAIVEAVARLLPGVIGNAESLVEESHEDGLLEYPVYTKPASWADGETTRDVPSVLLSGDHAAIARWRHDQRLVRTAARRPDLLHPSGTLMADGTHFDITPAVPADAPELLTLQRAAFVREIAAHGNDRFPALTEELEDVRRGLDEWTTVVVRIGGRLVGSARGRLLPDGTTWEVSRVMVAPDVVRRGLGQALLTDIETRAPAQANAFRLLVAAGAESTRRFYRKAGYRQTRAAAEVEGAVELTRRRDVPTHLR